MANWFYYPVTVKSRYLLLKGTSWHEGTRIFTVGQPEA